MAERSTRMGRIATLLGLSLALYGCGVATPPNVRSTASGLPRQVYLTSGQPDGSKASDMQAEFSKQLVAALESRGVTVQDGKGLGLSVAVALAPAEIGITPSLGAAGQPVVWSEAPRKHGMFDNCRPQRLRIVVSSLVTAADPQKLAEGDVSACRITAVQRAALAGKLAEDLTRR